MDFPQKIHLTEGQGKYIWYVNAYNIPKISCPYWLLHMHNHITLTTVQTCNDLKRKETTLIEERKELIIKNIHIEYARSYY